MNSNTPDTPQPTAPAQPAATPASPPRFLFSLVFLVWISVVMVATLVTFILPEWYVSTARIKVEHDRTDIRSSFDQSSAPTIYDPYFVATEFEIILSETILGKVVDDLKLNELWGKKYSDGALLKHNVAVNMVRGSLKLMPVRNTPLADIRASSGDPKEAAMIANQVARTYQRWRLDKSNELVRGGLESLKRQVKEQEEAIAKSTQELASLAEPPENGQLPDAKKLTYLQKQRDLEDMDDFRRLLIRKINIEESDLRLPRSEQVTIVESATPDPTPFRPNKPLNIVLGILIGGFIGLLLAVLVYLLERQAYRRQSGVAGTTNWRGYRNYLRVAIALVVGVAVGFNCADLEDVTSLIFIQLVVFLGGIAFAYVELAKPSPLPPAAPAESQLKGL